MAEKKTTSSIADKILRRKQDPELQKQLQGELADYDAKAEEESEVDKIIQSSKIQEAEALKRKRNSRLFMGFVGFLVVCGLSYFLFKPYEAGLEFGFCRVFLEQHVQYPDHLVLSEVEEKRNFIRIWYMQTDSFGQERLENMECYHGQDEHGNYYIAKVRVDRRDIDQKKVDLFNISLATIAAYPPELIYPRRLRDALGNIDIQTYLFRKPIF